jgi:hypothetical protein
MHSANPFGDGIDLKFFNASFKVWPDKIVNLLNNHKVHLVGDDGLI